jgi:PPOX class probable F420-dependent enzyme
MAGGKSTVAVTPEVQRLASIRKPLVIGTRRPDGSIQLNPIWFEYRDGYFIVNSATHRSWPKNLQREKRATLLLTDPDEPERYAQVQGRLAEVIPDPDHQVIDRLARRYTGRTFRDLEPGEERITFRIEPVKITGAMI